MHSALAFLPLAPQVACRASAQARNGARLTVHLDNVLSQSALEKRACISNDIHDVALLTETLATGLERADFEPRILRHDSPLATLGAFRPDALTPTFFEVQEPRLGRSPNRQVLGAEYTPKFFAPLPRDFVRVGAAQNSSACAP